MRNMIFKLVSSRLNRLFAASMLISMQLFSGVSSAAEIPFDHQRVSMTAREQNIVTFLESFFWEQGLKVSVSDRVEGQINGKFEGKPKELFEDITQAFGLVSYFDGYTVYVYRSTEVDRVIHDLDPSGSAWIYQSVTDQDLPDEYNSLFIGRDGVLVANGVAPFLNEVANLVDIYRARDASSEKHADEIRVFRLKYAWADDRKIQTGDVEVEVPGVASLLRSIILGEQGPSRVADSNSSTRGGKIGRRQGQLNEDDLNDPDTVEENSDRLTSRSGDPDIRIESDVRLNAVIVKDHPGRMAMYEKLIEELDVVPPLVEISATILDVDMTKMTETGVQWRFSDVGGEFDITSVQNNLGLPLGSAGTVNPFANGLLASGVVGDNNVFSARLTALQQEGLAKVVSRPQILTLSNVEAVFNNLETLFLPVFGEREVDLFDVSAGTELRVTPHVINDGGKTKIRLIVNVRDGQVLNRGAASDSVGGGVGASIVESGVDTAALIEVGQSLLVGGMTVTETETIEDRVPGLGSVPLLGRAFRSTSDRERRYERMILLTPRLITSNGQTVTTGPQAVHNQASSPAQSIAQPYQGTMPEEHMQSLPWKPLSAERRTTHSTGGQYAAGANHPLERSLVEYAQGPVAEMVQKDGSR